jgi:cytochrome c oxidase assembly protein subunit 15
LIGLAVAAWFAFRAVGAPGRPAAWLIAIIAAQGFIGFIQYATHLPAVLVGVHMAGACAVWIATLSLLYATRTRPAPGTSADRGAAVMADAA